MQKLFKIRLLNKICVGFSPAARVSGKAKKTAAIMLSLLSGLFFYQDARAADARNVLKLKAEAPFSNAFKNSERHYFSVSAEANEAVEIECERRGIDIGLTAFAPDGRKITASNSPRGFIGTDRLFFIADKAAAYQIRLESRRPGTMQGTYKIVLKPKRLAAGNDFDQAEAMRLLGAEREILSGADNRFEKAAKAMQALEKAVEIFVKTGDLQNQANALFHLGYLIANELGEDKRAVQVYEKALEVWAQIDDDAGKSICLTHAAYELRGSGDKEKSFVYFDKALLLNKKLNDKPDEAVTLSFFCRLLNDTQNFQKGFEACRTSLSLTGETDPLTDYFSYSMLSNLSANTGDMTNGHKYQKITLERITPIKDYLNPIRLANVKAGIGSFLHKEKKYLEAISYFQDALAVSEAVKRPIFSAGYLTQLGSIYFESGQFEKALEHGEKSLELYRRFDARRRFDALNIIGKSRAALEQNSEARRIFLESLAFFQSNNDRYAEAETLFNLAQLEKSDDNDETAREYARSAVKISEIIRSGILGGTSRSSYLTILKSYYELEIELLLKLHEKTPNAGFSEQAWQTHEKIRARSLLENFVENGLNLNSIAPPEFYAGERNLLEAIAAAELKRGEAEKTGNLADQKQAETALQKSLENYQLMQEEVRRKNPQFSAINQLKDFSFADAQNLLDRDTAFLEFALGRDRSYAWLIRRDSVKLFKLPAGGDLNRAAREFYLALATRSAKNENSAFEKSKQLSRQVLTPVAADLADIKRLIVIADGSLQLIPFAALTITPDAEYQPLAATTEIVNALSFSSSVYLRENKSNRQNSPDKLLTIFADPIFQADDERFGKNRKPKTAANSTDEAAKLTQTLRDFGVERLARLPFTNIEAQDIAKFAPQQTILALGANASRRNFLDGNYNSYKILHFATHGFLNQQNPDLSGLVLSLYDEKRQSQNGFLRVIDLYSLSLNADLVVLSACQTGLGKEVDGEGIVGLTRGFMFAGASSVVSSLWKVEDAATAELMKRFYRQMLKENQTPSAALRHAQNELRQIPRFSHPRYWAGFVLTGEWR